MIPVIAASGSSFKGAFLYYFHDKKALTTARIAWTQTVNMMTDCAAKACKIMAYTAIHQERLKEASGQKVTGAKLCKPVFAYSLSWHPEQNPDKETMLRAANQSLAKLGLQEHEAVIAAHQDESHPHIHVIVNKVHPLTGMVAKLKYTKRHLSDFALEWEKQEGKIYCKQRTTNKQKREQGQHTKYADPVILEAWKSPNFAQALQNKGYSLAQGRKRIVIIDRYGKSHNPLRHLHGVNSKEFHARMNELTALDKPRPVEVDIEALNALQSRYYEDRHILRQHHHRRIIEAEESLSQYYQLQAKAAAIKALQHKTVKPSLWRKLLGLAKRDREELRVLKLNYMSAKQRYNEQINALKKKCDQDIKQLQAKQEKEKQALQCYPLSNAQTITKTVNGLKSVMTQTASTHQGGPEMGM